jgi:GTPase Era involved in 16S rRNA processing
MAKGTKQRNFWKKDEASSGSNDLVTDPRESDVIVLIIGLSGVGKSTFINAAARKDAVIIGHDLESGTKKVQPVVVPYPGDPTRRVVLVDTPGFDDTWVGDIQILKQIVEWVDRSCAQGMKLVGIIYLHDISQPRVASAKESLNMFQNRNTVKNVILATTKWDVVKPELGRQREQQLPQHWKGSDIVRFNDTPTSAREIVELILKKNPNDALPIREDLSKFLVREASPKSSPTGRSGFFTFLFGKR